MYRYSVLPGLLRDRAEQLLSEQGLDAIIVYGDVNWMYAPLMRLCRERGILLLADLTEMHKFRARLLLQPFWWDQRLYGKRFYPRLDGIVAISRPWVRAARCHGVPALRVPAMGEAEAQIPSARQSGETESFVLTYLGVLGPRDLPGTLMEGVRRAVVQGADLRLVCVGRTDCQASGRRAMRQVRSDPVLRERVTFTGWVSDEEVQEHLCRADALVLLRPDTRESRACFPTRLPEYLLTGRPVILSSAGDPSLYFQHRKNAWLVPPGDQPEELCKALVHLSSHRDEARAIGRAGQEVALNEFSYLKHGRRLLEFLRALQKRAAGKPLENA